MSDNDDVSIIDPPPAQTPRQPTSAPSPPSRSSSAPSRPKRKARALTVDEDEVMDRCAVLGADILKRGGLKVPGKWPIL